MSTSFFHRARPRRRLALVAALVLILGLGGCGSSEDETRAEIDVLPSELLPPEVLGLRVAQEDTQALVHGVEESYLEAVGLWSFRRDDLLQATLQVSRFNDRADLGDERFRRAVANQVGPTISQELRLSNQAIFLSSGERQTVAVWFFDDQMFVMAARDDFDSTRALLRALVELDLT